MQSPSLKTKLYGFLKQKYPDAVHSVDLEDFARNLGYKSSNSGRRLRELYNEGKIGHEYRDWNGERIVWYRYILPQGETEKHAFYKESGKLQVQIVTLPNGERVAREVMI